MRKLLLIVLVCFASEVWATDYYISNSGTDTNTFNCDQAHPCQTWNFVRPKLASGDTAYFRAGNYPGFILTPSTRIPNGTGDTTRTTVAGFPGEVVNFTSQIVPSWSSAVPGVSDSTLEYILFKNFRVIGGGLNLQGCSTTWPSTPTCGVHHVRYEDIEVTNVGQSCVLMANSGMTYIEFVRVKAHDCGGSHLDHGFYVSGLNLTFDGVEAWNNNGYGMHMYDNSSYCAGQHRCNTNNVVKNSSFHNNGINDGAGAVIGHGDNILFYNNIVYSNRSGGVHATFGNSDNTQIYNNTIYGNGSYAISLGSPSPSTQTNTKIRNNILVNNSSGTVENFSSTGTTYSKNLCSSATLGCDVIGAPVFQDSANADFRLTLSSDARNAGLPRTEFDTDRAGIHRPQGVQWDIGAYEYPEGTAPISGNPIYVAKTGLDSWSCTEAEDPAKAKLTLASACGCMTVPGKTMYIKAGTYVEKWDTGTCAITGGNGPSFSDATIIAGYASDVVTLRLSSGMTDTPVMFLRNGVNDKYTIYRNLIIDANNVSGSNGIALYPNVHHIRFENVEVKNTLTGYETVFIYGANNIGFYDSRISASAYDCIAIDGTVDAVTVQRSKLSGCGSSGIRLLPSSTVTNTTIRETDMSSNAGDGATFSVGTGFFLANNRIYSNAGGGIILSNVVQNAEMYFQSITGNTSYGIQCPSGATGVAIKNVIAYNNTAGNILNSCSAATETNFITNPLFTNAATGDLTLQDASGAIDQGTPIAGISNDFAGLNRPQGATDIGSEERLATPVGPGSDVTVRARLLYQTGMMF